jgi:hypothetical protein
MSTATKNIGTPVTMDTTGLTALAGSTSAACWQSPKVDDTATKALDYQVSIALAMGNSAPAADKCVYAWIVPWFCSGTSAWSTVSNGTPVNFVDSTTGGATLINWATNNLGGAQVISMGSASEIINKTFNLSTFFGSFMPDGWQLIFSNYTTAAITSSAGTLIQYKPIKMDAA